MKALTIKDPDLILGIQDEIRRTEEARYDHRLHAILLVGQGMSSPKVARYLGDAPRTVQTWMKRFDEGGFAGLSDQEGRGRKSRLSEEQFEEIGQVLRKRPEENGMNGNLWDGKLLSEFIKKRYLVTLCTRQCQRIFRQLGFRLRKPRPLIAHADEDAQRALKKTPKTPEGYHH